MLNGENPLYRDFPHASFETEGGVAKIQKPNGTTYFAYNDANLVSSIHYSDDTWAYFHYDGMLRRYAIQDDEFGLSYFTWDQNGVNLLAERDESGTVTARYTHDYAPVEGIGSMVKAERIEGGCTYYQFPVYDHRGTVHKLVDRSGETVGNYVYNAFGEILDQTNPPEGNRFKFMSAIALKEDMYLTPTAMYSGSLGRTVQKNPAPAVRERGSLGVFENSGFAGASKGRSVSVDWSSNLYGDGDPSDISIVSGLSSAPSMQEPYTPKPPSVSPCKWLGHKMGVPQSIIGMVNESLPNVSRVDGFCDAEGYGSKLDTPIPCCVHNKIGVKWSILEPNCSVTIYFRRNMYVTEFISEHENQHAKYFVDYINATYNTYKSIATTCIPLACDPIRQELIHELETAYSWRMKSFDSKLDYKDYSDLELKRMYRQLSILFNTFANNHFAKAAMHHASLTACVIGQSLF